MVRLHLKTLFQSKWYYVSMILWKAFIDLAIVHLCSELLFCKKRYRWVYPCRGLVPLPRGKAAVEAVEISSGYHSQRKQEDQQSGGEGGQQTCSSQPTAMPGASGAGRRAGRWQSQGDTSSVCPTWHNPQAEVQQGFASGSTLKLLAAFEQPHGAPVLSWAWEAKYNNVGLQVFITMKGIHRLSTGLGEAGREEKRV